jgi:hypothetical protein
VKSNYNALNFIHQPEEKWNTTSFRKYFGILSSNVWSLSVSPFVLEGEAKRNQFKTLITEDCKRSQTMFKLKLKKRAGFRTNKQGNEVDTF